GPRRAEPAAAVARLHRLRLPLVGGRAAGPDPDARQRRHRRRNQGHEEPVLAAAPARVRAAPGEVAAVRHRLACRDPDGARRNQTDLGHTSLVAGKSSAGKRRRILVTGVARWWGALLVQRLRQAPDVGEVIGIDIREPLYDLGRADYLKLDIRHSLIGKLVRAVGIDTVVHTLTRIDSFDMAPARAHEMNVIGTLNLLAGCAGEGSPVRRFVLKSSGHVSGPRHVPPPGTLG